MNYNQRQIWENAKILLIWAFYLVGAIQNKMIKQINQRFRSIEFQKIRGFLAF